MLSSDADAVLTAGGLSHFGTARPARPSVAQRSWKISPNARSSPAFALASARTGTSLPDRSTGV
jgi:hypothetical protein